MPLFERGDLSLTINAICSKPYLVVSSRHPIRGWRDENQCIKTINPFGGEIHLSSHGPPESV